MVVSSSVIEMPIQAIFSMLRAELQNKEMHRERTTSHNEGQNHKEGFEQGTMEITCETQPNAHQGVSQLSVALQLRSLFGRRP